MHDWEDVENWACAVLTFEDGTRATCLASDAVLGGMDDTVHLYLPNARINCNFTHSTALQAHAPTSQSSPGEPLQEKLSTNAGWSYPPLDMEYLLGYAPELQDFAGAIAEDRPPLSDGALGRAVVEAIYGAYLAAETGRRVTSSRRPPTWHPDIHPRGRGERGPDQTDAPRNRHLQHPLARLERLPDPGLRRPAWGWTWCSSPPARTSPPTTPATCASCGPTPTACACRSSWAWAASTATPPPSAPAGQRRRAARRHARRCPSARPSCAASWGCRATACARCPSRARGGVAHHLGRGPPGPRPGIRIAVENHGFGDFLAPELKAMVEEAGPDIAAVTLDTGTPYRAEDPLYSAEVLAPYIATTHFRDTAIWEYEARAQAQWTVLGQGTVDLPAIVRLLQGSCPGVAVDLDDHRGPPRAIPYLDLPERVLAPLPEMPAQALVRYMASPGAGRGRQPAPWSSSPASRGCTRRPAGAPRSRTSACGSSSAGDFRGERGVRPGTPLGLGERPRWGTERASSQRSEFSLPPRVAVERLGAGGEIQFDGEGRGGRRGAPWGWRRACWRGCWRGPAPQGRARGAVAGDGGARSRHPAEITSAPATRWTRSPSTPSCPWPGALPNLTVTLDVPAGNILDKLKVPPWADTRRTAWCSA